MNTQSSPSSKSPMSEALDALSSSHERLTQQLERAFHRFNPVLAPAEPSKGVTAVSENRSYGSVVDTINHAASFMNQQVELFQDFNDRGVC